MHPMPPALVPFATRKIAEKQRKECCKKERELNN
jgi:hypothetical protein